MNSQQIVLTQSGYNDLKEEYEYLVNVQRPEVVKRIDEARSHGDLSENEPYQEARRAQAQIEERIKELEDILRSAKVVQASQANVIGVGCKVVVKQEGATREFHLVGEHEADITAGKLSHSSPIGQALMGKKVGDKVNVTIPAGQTTFEILEIK